MKKSVLFIIVVLFYFGNPHRAVAQNSQVVANGGITSPLSFNGCQTSWTNDNPAIGLPASGVGDISSFRAVNTGNMPITATITANPASFAFIIYSGGNTPDLYNTATGAIVYTFPFSVIAKGSVVSHDQQSIYTLSRDGIVRIDVLTGTTTTFNTPTLTYVANLVLNASGHCADRLRSFAFPCKRIRQQGYNPPDRRIGK